MTRYGDRDPAGRLPLRQPDQFGCRRVNPRSGRSCAGPDRHRPPCRRYDPETEEWYAGPGRWERTP
jgi:hypothetical protein